VIAARVRLYRFTLPLERPLPLKHETLHERVGYLLALTDEAGLTGWGEAAPLPGFSAERLSQVEARLRESVPRLAGYRLPEHYDELEGAGLLALDGPSAVSFAIETAYLNLRAAQENMPLYRYLNPQAPAAIPCNALLMNEGEGVEARAEAIVTQGFQTVKLKVGALPLAEDIDRVRKVREALGPTPLLRLDGNRAWSLADALAFAEAVEGLHIEYIEEPLLEPWELELYGQKASLPYAVDETLHQFYKLVLDTPKTSMASLPADFPERAQRLSRIIAESAAAVWKPTLMHVPRMAEAIAAKTFALPIPRLVLSACFESGVGLNAVAQFAAAYGAADCAAGLDTYSWLKEDVLRARLPLPSAMIDLAALDAAAREVDTDRLECLLDLSADDTAS